MHPKLYEGNNSRGTRKCSDIPRSAHRALKADDVPPELTTNIAFQSAELIPSEQPFINQGDDTSHIPPFLRVPALRIPNFHAYILQSVRQSIPNQLQGMIPEFVELTTRH